MKIRLVEPAPGYDNWFCTWVLLVDNKVPLGKIWKVMKLREEDPTKPLYGIDNGSLPVNLKKITRTSGVYDWLSKDEVIEITYSKTEGIVHFDSKDWSYFQTELPKDVEFAVAVSM